MNTKELAKVNFTIDYIQGLANELSDLRDKQTDGALWNLLDDTVIALCQTSGQLETVLNTFS